MTVEIRDHSDLDMKLSSAGLIEIDVVNGPILKLLPEQAEELAAILFYLAGEAKKQK